MTSSERSNSPQPVDLIELAQARKTRLQGVRRKADRLLQLARTFPPRQIVARLSMRLKAKLGLRYSPSQPTNSVKARSFKESDGCPFQRLFEIGQTHELNAEPQFQTGSFDPTAFLTGNVRLLNQSYELGWPIDWSTSVSPRPSHLWRFQLHYHEFLLDLIRDDKQWPLVWQSIEHWLLSNLLSDKRVLDDAWHPYCISRRIPVWLKLLASDSSLEAERQLVIMKSAFDQADNLAHNLETDLRGNHLLENYHALAMAGCYFIGTQPTRWLEIVKQGLAAELKTQILPSGEHFERSPMYHCVIVGNLLQLAIASRDIDEALYELVSGYARLMLKFLDGITMPDGEIPLLSDSCFAEAASVNLIQLWRNHLAWEVDTSKPQNETNKNEIAKTVGDYWIHRRANDMLLFDAGPVAAEQLPAHGHCDLLNVVGAVNGRRLIVDSGNSSYDLDNVRTYCRSSVAHNVLTIDDLDHCDVWSKFRMGFKGRPNGLEMGTVDSNGRKFQWAKSSHDAYAPIDVANVTRVVASDQEEMLWICLDHLSPDAQSAAHKLDGFLHFSPDVIPSISNSGELSVRFRCSDSKENKAQVYRVGFLGVDNWELAKSWYCPQFGLKIDNYSVMYSAHSNRSTMLGWYVCPIDSGFAKVSESDPSAIEIIRLNQTTSTLPSYIDLF